MDTTKLVAFLGTGKYEEVLYEWEGQEFSSRFAPHAIAKLLLMTGRAKNLSEVTILCTREAEDKHGKALSECFEKDLGLSPRLKEIPWGDVGKGQWRLFESLLEEVTHAKSHLVLDITFGFRAQPFFAAAVLVFAKAIDRCPSSMQVLYAGDVQQGKPTRVWDITRFIEVVEWASGLGLFMKTGRGAEVADMIEKYGKEKRKRWALGGKQGSETNIVELGKAVREFSEHLETIRTGALVGGQRPDEEPKSRALAKAIEKARNEVIEELPPLALVLENMEKMAKGLDGGDDLTKERGLLALVALARLYLQMGRYIEAATTLREAWITAFAEPSKVFCREGREEAEKLCVEHLGQTYSAFANLRNDLDHGGMNESPGKPSSIKRGLEREIERFEKFIKERVG